MVYNEWGAVIAHQDEMDKALREQEKRKNKEMQQRYRDDLDNQRALVARKHRDNAYQDLQISQGMLDYQRAKDDQKLKNEDARRIQIRDQVIAKQKESLADRERAIKEEKDIQKQMQEEARLAYMKLMEQNKREDEEKKMQKEQFSRGYKNDLWN